VPSRAQVQVCIMTGLGSFVLSLREDTRRGVYDTLWKSMREMREIRTLAEAEVLRRWAELYAAGKHMGYARPNPSHYLGKDRQIGRDKTNGKR
jgi:hypothetical protein